MGITDFRFIGCAGWAAPGRTQGGPHIWILQPQGPASAAPGASVLGRTGGQHPPPLVNETTGPPCNLQGKQPDGTMPWRRQAVLPCQSPSLNHRQTRTRCQFRIQMPNPGRWRPGARLPVPGPQARGGARLGQDCTWQEPTLKAGHSWGTRTPALLVMDRFPPSSPPVPASWPPVRSLPLSLPGIRASARGGRRGSVWSRPVELKTIP